VLYVRVFVNAAVGVSVIGPMLPDTARPAIPDDFVAPKMLTAVVSRPFHYELNAMESYRDKDVAPVNG
jgi:hypothetical protein